MYFSDKQRNIYNEICSWLVSGRYVSGQQLPKEVELAQYFQVARETLRRVLSRLEKENMIARIKRKGTFAQYKKKNKAGKKTAQPKTALFITIPGNEDLFITLVNALADNGIHALPQILESEFMDHIESGDMQSRIRKAVDNGMDSIIVEGSRHFPYVLLKELRDNGIQIIFLKDFWEGDEFPESVKILIDFFKCGYKAASHLIENGFKRLAYFSHAPISNQYAMEKGVCLKPDSFLEGIRCACADLKVESLEIIHDAMWGKASPERDSIIKNFMSRGKCGIIMRDDCRARIIYPAAASFGLKIGIDLGITGCYNLEPYVTTLSPSLTSLKTDGKEIALLAAQALTEAWKGKKIFLEPELVERESTTLYRNKYRKTCRRGNAL